MTVKLGVIPIDLFVCINFTGRPPPCEEKWRARFCNSPFLKDAEHVVSKLRKYLLKEKVLTEGQLERGKGAEVVSELLMSLQPWRDHQQASSGAGFTSRGAGDI